MDVKEIAAQQEGSFDLFIIGRVDLGVVAPLLSKGLFHILAYLTFFDHSERTSECKSEKQCGKRKTKTIAQRIVAFRGNVNCETEKEDESTVTGTRGQHLSSSAI